MKESKSNIGAVHSSCAPKPDPIIAKKPVDWFIGKHVKLGFSVPQEIIDQGGPKKEHMWVKVTRGVQEDEPQVGEELVGTLDNDPSYATDWTCGDTIGFRRDEVEVAILEDGRLFRPGMGQN